MTPFVNGLASDAFDITPSDTADIKDDPNNPREYQFCLLHNPGESAVSVRVLPAAAVAPPEGTLNDRAVKISVPAGEYSRLQVRRVYATDPVVAEGALVAYVILGR